MERRVVCLHGRPRRPVATGSAAMVPRPCGPLAEAGVVAPSLERGSVVRLGRLPAERGLGSLPRMADLGGCTGGGAPRTFRDKSTLY